MENCKECSKQRLWRNTGKRDKLTGAIIRECTNCGHHQAEPRPQGLLLPKSFLYYDIETSKMTVTLETFDLKQYNNYLSWEDVTQGTRLLCWSACWITPATNSKNIKVISDSVTPWEATHGKDKRCLQKLWDLMNKADYLVGHNVKSFDTKKVHNRFIQNGMPAPDLSVKQLDTLTEARKRFKNDSNTLGYWLKCFGEQGKDLMTSEDWDLCKRGDKKALAKMEKYNRQDVRGGALLFLHFKEYIESGGGTLYK